MQATADMPSPVASNSNRCMAEDIGAAEPPVCGPPPPTTASEEQGNTVAPFSKTPSPAEPPGAGGLSPAAQGAVDAARTLLETRASKLDFFVTESEAKQALDGLSKLTPEDFAAAVGELSSRGHLATMVDKLSWEDQCRFLAVAKEKGMLKREQGDHPTGLADPPAHPDLYEHDAKLPREVNDLIHEHSKACVSQYKAEYDAYEERFVDLVKAAKTPAEIRALGRPDSGHIAWELTDFRDPANSRYDRDWDSRMACSPFKIYQAVSARMSELSGERNDGSVWFEGKLEGKLGALSGEVAVVLPPKPGASWITATGAVAGKRGPNGVETKVKTDGTVEHKAKGEAKGVKIEGKVARDRDGSIREVTADAGPVGGMYHKEKGVGVRIAAVKAGDLAEVGAKTYVNPTTAELRGGTYAKAKTPSGFAEVKAEANMAEKGLTPRSSARALAHLSGHREGVLDTPEELEQGKSWASLSPQRKEFLQGLRWSKEEWTARLPAGSEQ